MRRPTRRQLEVLRAYIAVGSIAPAAYELGISGTTARRHLSGLYQRTGCLNGVQAAYWLGRSVAADRVPGPTEPSHRIHFLTQRRTVPTIDNR